jgi:hypothetical protein
MSGKSDVIDISVELKAKTPKAIRVYDGTIECWLPLSQIEYEVNRDGTYTVTLPEWLAKEKELI